MNKQELFQEYMIQIGQWKLVNWQVTIDVKANFVPKERLKDWFDKWIKTNK